MKDILEGNHREIVKQYEETMGNQFNKLKTRLQEALEKNMDLEENIFSLTQKLEEASREKVLKNFFTCSYFYFSYLSLCLTNRENPWNLLQPGKPRRFF